MGDESAMLLFAEAHAELRRVCPRGDLRIHLSVEADKPEDVLSDELLEERRRRHDPA